MNSRERVLAACNREVPDQVPVDFWATSKITLDLIQHYQVKDEEELLKLLGIDMRYIPGPEYIGPSSQDGPFRRTEDIWGVKRTQEESGAGERYQNVSYYPLAHVTTVKEVEDYPHWPSPDWFDYSVVVKQASKYKGKAIVYSGGRLNRTSQLKAAIYLRGMQRVLEDLILSPKVLEAILEKIREYYLEFNRRLFEAANNSIDIFMMGDDFGMQENLLCRKEKWDTFFKPGLIQYIDLAKKYGIKTMHHSCGAIEPLIPDFINMGLDVLNPIQPEASGMDPKELKRKFGQDITFHGSISIQKTLPYGTREDVQNEVMSRIQDLGPEGFILCTTHNLQSDISIENMEALFEAYKRYRKI